MYRAGFSRDLRDWSELTGAESGTSPLLLPAGFEQVTVEADAGLLQEPLQFGRLEILPPP